MHAGASNAPARSAPLSALALATTVIVSACGIVPSGPGADDCEPDSLTGTVDDGVYFSDWDASAYPCADSFTLHYSYSRSWPVEGGHDVEEVVRRIEGAVPPVQINYLDSLYYVTGSKGRGATLLWHFQHIWVELVAVVDGEESDGVGDEFNFPFPMVRAFYDEYVVNDEGDLVRARFNLEAPFTPDAGWTDSVTVYWDTSPGITRDSPNRHTFTTTDETVDRTAFPGVRHYFRAIGYSAIGSSGLSPEIMLYEVRR